MLRGGQTVTVNPGIGKVSASSGQMSVWSAMKYIPLIWSGIWRRPGRSVLMLLQIASAFTLFGVLQGLSSGEKLAIASTHSNRLYVMSRVSTGDLMPIGMLSRIGSIPGVRAVTPRTVLVGTYVRPNQHVPVIGADAEPFFGIYDELKVSPPGAVQALKNTRSGAIIGNGLMQRYGLKVGDRLVLNSSVAKHDGSRDWVFDVVGVFLAPESQPGTPPPTGAIANFDYLNEARVSNVDRADMFIAAVTDMRQAGAASLAIDNAFANSDHETRTQSEGDFLTTQLQRTVDLDFIVHSIIAAVFFASLLATAALMMLSLRERIPELAVLKTIGFSDQRILVLSLVESTMFCLLAAAIGLAAGAALLPQARAYVGVARTPPSVFAAGFGCALLLAFIAGAAPALLGARLQVVDALAEH
jgi:putative ABC transport system permease protein